MAKLKVYTKGQILEAMDKTKSVIAASRYLGCGYDVLKRYMKLFKDEETGKTLFELHKNQCGKGVPKFLSNKTHHFSKLPNLQDIINGVVDASNFNSDKIKYRLLQEDYLRAECYRCGFHEERVVDNKIPSILNFKNRNKNNYRLDNIELLCYNCMFLYVGEVFNEQDLISMEEKRSIFKTSDRVNFELDDYHINKLKEIGMWDEEKEYNIVSRRE